MRGRKVCSFSSSSLSFSWLHPPWILTWSCSPRLQWDPGWISPFSGAGVLSCIVCWGITDSFSDMFDDSMVPPTHFSGDCDWITLKYLSVGTNRECGTFTLCLACPDSPSEKIRSCPVYWFSLTMRLVWCYLCYYCSGSSCGKHPRKLSRLVEAGMGLRLSPVG